MADHDRASMPAVQKCRDGASALPVEIVRRLVKQEEIGLPEDKGSQCGSRALTAGQGRKPCRGGRVEADVVERLREPAFQGPVGSRKLAD